MINSLFMLGSSYNKNRIISIAFMLGWIAYMLIGSNLSLGLTFPLVNAIIFIIISISISLIKNKRVNTILAIFSILIWSVVIDSICYFLYPIMVGDQTIFEYIFQGIVFNSKYIFSNIIAIGIISIIDIAIKRIKEGIKCKASFWANEKTI